MAHLELPCPTVSFEPGFAARVERFSARLRAARERREALGALPGAHGGHEFVGYRAYSSGDDPRAIDWNALARLDRALVRVTKAEAGERWTIAVDASASMGVGPPGKLQRAAECAAALAALALRSSARARVIALPGARAIDVDRRARLADLFKFLEGLIAEGRVRGADLHALEIAGAARVFVVSDLLSFEPRDVMALASARRQVVAIRILAPHELDSGVRGAVEWVDAEAHDRLALDVDESTRARYETVLGAELERWRDAAARARASHVTASSALPFETVLEKALRGRE